MDTNNNTTIVSNETIELGIQHKNIQEIKQDKTKISLKKKVLNYAKKAFDYGSKIAAFIALAGVSYLLLKGDKDNTINNSNGIKPLGNSNDNTGKISIDEIAKFGNCSETSGTMYTSKDYNQCMLLSLSQMLQNNIKASASDTLNNAKEYADDKILEVNNSLKGYVTLSDLSEKLSKYFTKDETNSLLTNLLKNYVLKDDNSFITKENIIQILQDNKFLTQEQIENLFDEKYIKIDDALNILGNYVEEDTLNEILNNYVTIESLNDTIKKEDLENILKKYNFVTNEDLQEILKDFADTSDFIDINYLNNVLKEYMSTSDVNTILADYIKSTELESYLTINDFRSTIENYVSKEDFSAMESSLNNFVKVSDLKNTLSNYLQKDDINKMFADFIKSDEFKNNFLNYVTFDDLQAELSNLTTKENITNIVHDIIKDSGFVTRQELNELRGAITGNRTPIQNQNASNKIKQLNADNSIDDEFMYTENKEVANTMYKVRSDISSIAGGLYTAGGGIAVAGLCIGGSIYANQAMGSIKKKSKFSKIVAGITGVLKPIRGRYQIDHEIIKAILYATVTYCKENKIYDIEKDLQNKKNEKIVKQMIFDTITEIYKAHSFLSEKGSTLANFLRMLEVNNANIEERFVDFDNKIVLLRQDLNDLDERILRVEEDVKELKEDVKNIKNDLASLKNGVNNLQNNVEVINEELSDPIGKNQQAKEFHNNVLGREAFKTLVKEYFTILKEITENNRRMYEEGAKVDDDRNNGVNTCVNRPQQRKNDDPNETKKQSTKKRTMGEKEKQKSFQERKSTIFSGTRNL